MGSWTDGYDRRNLRLVLRRRPAAWFGRGAEKPRLPNDATEVWFAVFCQPCPGYASSVTNGPLRWLLPKRLAPQRARQRHTLGRRRRSHAWALFSATSARALSIHLAS